MEEIAVIQPEGQVSEVRRVRPHRPVRVVRTRPVEPQAPAGATIFAEPTVAPAFEERSARIERAIAAVEVERGIAEARRRADVAIVGYAPDPVNFGHW